MGFCVNTWTAPPKAYYIGNTFTENSLKQKDRKQDFFSRYVQLKLEESFTQIVIIVGIMDIKKIDHKKLIQDVQPRPCQSTHINTPSFNPFCRLHFFFHISFFAWFSPFHHHLYSPPQSNFWIFNHSRGLRKLSPTETSLWTFGSLTIASSASHMELFSSCSVCDSLLSSLYHYAGYAKHTYWGRSSPYCFFI